MRLWRKLFPPMYYPALFLILAACIVALFNWRWGLYAAIFIALVQDPLRKIMPGAPALMAMASIPVWLTALTNALLSGNVRPRAFLDQFPKMGQAMVVFAAYLILPAALSATYGRNTWQVTLLGVIMYTAVFLALCSGWRFPMHSRALHRLLTFYAVLTSILLIGGPLEYMGWNQRYAAIGTEAMGHVWFTHRAGGLYMIAGFFRSPDVMGWHASLVFMISIIMAVRSRGAMRVFWIALAVWGGTNTWLCGRRKMISMFPLFMGCYLLLIFKLRDIQRWVLSVAVLLVMLGLGWYLIESYVKSEALEVFYLSAFADAGGHIHAHGFGSVLTTIRQSGYWGHGLGMGQQGIHHIDAELPRIWQESGSSRIVVDLGVPGGILLLFVVVRLVQTAYQVLRHTARDDSFYVGAGLFAVLVANMIAALVSGQVYGDPFIITMLVLMLGLLLSAVRLRGENANADGSHPCASS